MSTPIAKLLRPNVLAGARRTTTNDNGHYRRWSKHLELRAKPLGHNDLNVGLVWAYCPPLARPGRFDGRTNATPCNPGRLRHRQPTPARGPFRALTGPGPGLLALCSRAGGGRLICPGLYFLLAGRVKGLYYSCKGQLTRLIARPFPPPPPQPERGIRWNPFMPSH